MIEIQPAEKINATVECPSSKSYTNRALLIAALADGECRLESPLFSDDTHYMSEALAAFGIPVKQEGNAFSVCGTGGRLQAPQKDIFVGNAGTTMRFLTTFATSGSSGTKATPLDAFSSLPSRLKRPKLFGFQSDRTSVTPLKPTLSKKNR